MIACPLSDSLEISVPRCVSHCEIRRLTTGSIGRFMRSGYRKIDGASSSKRSVCVRFGTTCASVEAAVMARMPGTSPGSHWMVLGARNQEHRAPHLRIDLAGVKRQNFAKPLQPEVPSF